MFINAVTKNYGYVLGILGIALLPSLLGVTGCNKDSGSTPSENTTASSQGNTAAPAAGGDATLIAAGKTVFSANNCVKCHSIAGQGGRGGPELTHVAAEAEHTPTWFVAHVKNPKTHNPRSRMPAFAGKINDKDLVALAAYLSSLK